MTAVAATEVLTLEQKGSIAWITLNRPEKCNALNSELSTALMHACRSIRDDAEIVILQGSGRHFCAGSDLPELYAANLHEAERIIQLEIDACHALASLRQITVAIVHGKCYGGGAFLPLYCDLRLGRKGVEFALPEVPFGWIPPYGVERLKTLLPAAFATEMLLFGRACGDQEALRQGWIHRLVHDGVDSSADLKHLLQLSPAALLDTVSFMEEKDLQKMRQADSTALQLFLQHLDTTYAHDKLESYMEKRRK